MNVQAYIVLLATILLEMGNNCESVKHFGDIIVTIQQHQADASANVENFEYETVESVSIQEEIFEEEILDNNQTLDNERFNSESLENVMVNIEIPDSKPLDNETLKIETMKEKTKLNEDTAKGQSKPATITTAKSTSEVHA